MKRAMKLREDDQQQEAAQQTRAVIEQWIGQAERREFAEDDIEHQSNAAA